MCVSDLHRDCSCFRCILPNAGLRVWWILNTYLINGMTDPQTKWGLVFRLLLIVRHRTKLSESFISFDCHQNATMDVTILGLVSLNNFDGLWATGVVPSYPSSGPRITKAEGYCLLGSPGQIKKVWFWINCLHIKSMLPVESFAILKNWLAPGGRESLQKPESFSKMSKHLNI